MPDDADVGQPVADLEGELVEVEIRVEEVALVLAPGFEGEVFAVRLGEEVFLALARAGGDVVVFPDYFAGPVGALGVYDCLAFFSAGDVFVAGVGLAGCCFCRVLLVADAQHVYTRQQRAVQVWLVAVDVAVETRVDPPLHDAECFVEEGRQTVADGVFEVVAEDQLVASDVVFGDEGEGYRVAVVWVLRGGEVGRGRGRAFGETWAC